MKPVTTAIPYLSASELACKGTGIIKLDPRFVSAWPVLREAWGSPITPNSVCRSPEHNKKEGGNPNSLHMTENPKWPTLGAMALDARWRGWTVFNQLRFARLAYSLGWSVGLHNGFCHIDRRADLGIAELTQKVFLYGEWDGRFKPSDITP
jgi:hypothetical protein